MKDRRSEGVEELLTDEEIRERHRDRGALDKPT